MREIGLATPRARSLLAAYVAEAARAHAVTAVRPAPDGPATR